MPELKGHTQKSQDSTASIIIPIGYRPPAGDLIENND
jgi:hypothetical protein